MIPPILPTRLVALGAGVALALVLAVEESRLWLARRDLTQMQTRVESAERAKALIEMANLELEIKAAEQNTRVEELRRAAERTTAVAAAAARQALAARIVEPPAGHGPEELTRWFESLPRP